MAIKFTVKEGPKESPNAVTFSLNARKTLNDDVMIFDHNEIDIILMPQKNKVVAFAKDEISEEVYEAQDRLFRFLCSKGVIAYDSVQGGNVYSSMEAAILESKELNAYDTTLLMISKFIDAERPLMEFEKAWNEEEEERLTDPGPEDSTEFDPEKYHDARQGSIPPNGQAYGISSIYRL
jgi:hypothetical protein